MNIYYRIFNTGKEDGILTLPVLCRGLCFSSVPPHCVNDPYKSLLCCAMLSMGRKRREAWLSELW
ncbi:UNVERIFIED_CONTAM: hypothetical protein FKN15_017059 [Acipenser sinensis]